MTVTVRHGGSLSALVHACSRHVCLITHSFALSNRIGANECCRELTLATRCHADARNRYARMALVKVHGVGYCGAHRLPDGKTAAEKGERGRPAGQAEKLFEGRLLQLFKASAPSVKIREF